MKIFFVFINSLQIFPHIHLTIPLSQQSTPSFSILLLHFHHSSLRELIASSFVLGEQRGTMVEWGLSLWQQAWDKRESEGHKEKRQQEQAQRGCWLLAGRQGSEHWLITLVSMHTAIKPWYTHICRLYSEYPPPTMHTQTETHFTTSVRRSKKKGGKEAERWKMRWKSNDNNEAI